MPYGTMDQVHFKQTWQDTVMHDTQQRMTKLLSRITMEPTSAGEAHYVDFLKKRDPIEKIGRDEDSPNIPNEWRRRKLTMRDFMDGCTIPNVDKFRTLDDPANEINTAMERGFGRQIDRLIIDALGGNAIEVVNKVETTIPFPAGQTIAVDFVENGAATDSNLTPGKVRRTLTLMGVADVETGLDDITFVGGPFQRESLLRYTEVGSADYNSVRPLVNGEIDTWLGMKFIWMNLLPKTGNVRDCYAFVKRGVKGKWPQEPRFEMDPARSDKQFNPYIFAQMTLGCTRLEEVLVVKIRCDETK